MILLNFLFLYYFLVQLFENVVCLGLSWWLGEGGDQKLEKELDVMETKVVAFDGSQNMTTLKIVTVKGFVSNYYLFSSKFRTIWWFELLKKVKNGKEKSKNKHFGKCWALSVQRSFLLHFRGRVGADLKPDSQAAGWIVGFFRQWGWGWRK